MGKRILLILISFSCVTVFAEGDAISVGSSGLEAAALQAKDRQIGDLVTRWKSKVPATKAEVARAAASSAPVSSQKLQLTQDEVFAAVDGCEVARKAAFGACAEFLSPDIAGFMKDHGHEIQAMSMMAGGIGEQCKGISKTLTTAQVALGAYQVACSAAQAVCSRSCGNAIKKIEEFSLEAKRAEGEALRTASAAASTPAAASAAQVAAKDAKSINTTSTTQYTELKNLVSQQTSFCVGFKENSKNAISGLLGLLMGQAKAKQCEEMNRTQADMSVNCQKPGAPGYDSPSCKCARNELTVAECQNININPNSATAAKVAGGGAGGTNSDGTPIGPEGMDPGLTAGGPGAGGPAGGAPDAPAGGGGGMGGAGGGGSGGAQDGLAGTKKTNTNIFGGGFGGSGGGGGFGAGPGYGEMDEKLKQYMPGGSLDPKRNLASQLANEVTPQGGRTNWEKVRLRYRDNYRSLMGQ